MKINQCALESSTTKNAKYIRIISITNYSIPLLVITIINILCSNAVAESLDNLVAIVRIEQSRSFSDIERLETTLQTAPLAKVQLPQGNSPSELIRDIYGFGSSDSKEAYQLVEGRILELNDASSPTRLRAGEIIVPDLPVLTSRYPDPSKEANVVVKNKSEIIKIKTREKYENLQFAYYDTVRFAASISNSLTYTRIELYPANEAAEIIAAAASNGVNLPAGIEAGIQLSNNSDTCNEPAAQILSADERHTISEALKAPFDKTERYVLVLDTGWPTLDDQRRSLKIIRGIFEKVREGIRLPTFATSRFEHNVKPSEFVSSSHSHACMISRSLHEFVDLDKNERIKFVFLPLRPGQTRTRDLYREIIELDQIIIGLGGELFARPPSSYQVRSAKEFAERALDHIPALIEPWTAGDDVVRIYEPLISGLIRILDTYARISPSVAPGMNKVDARFWLSFSWHFTKFSATPTLPSSSNYMVFAAAGNDGRDFVEGHRLFASEAASGWRVFAVMNNDSRLGVLTCKSALYKSLWDEEITTNIGSFPGQIGIAPSQPCPGGGGGTSFSTPRLAWLAAVSDVALRAKDLNWPKTLSLRLLKSREKIDGDPHAAPIRVLKLFSSK